MLPEQQRILGYFIEEAGDHLNTIEQGLLNLQGTIEDPEMVNEVFRAAHSVKGGAAMLGLGSIQHIAHRLEDSFKILKDKPIRIDQHLESLFLSVFDALQELLEQLQTQGALSESVAAQTLAGVEPVFAQLDRHLETLVNARQPEPMTARSRPMTPMPLTLPPTTAWDEDEDSSALQLIFQSDAIARLREMLKLFKQPDSPATREKLCEICRLLGQAGEQFELTHWTHLLNAAQQAIANPNNTFSTLASVLIKELKQAQELVLANRADEITIDAKLQALLPFMAAEAPASHGDESLDIYNTSIDLDDQTLETASELTMEGNLHPKTAEEVTPPARNPQPERPPRRSSANGPEVGMAELNTLADLFEGEAPDLESWEATGEILQNTSDPDLDGDNSDFSEFLLEEEKTHSSSTETADMDETSIDLFGFDFDQEAVDTPIEKDEPISETAVEPLDDLFADVEDNLFVSFSESGDPSNPESVSSTPESPPSDQDWEDLWGIEETENNGISEPMRPIQDDRLEPDLSWEDLFDSSGETNPTMTSSPQTELFDFNLEPETTPVDELSLDEWSLDDLFSQEVESLSATPELEPQDVSEEDEAWDLFADLETAFSDAEQGDASEEDSSLEEWFESAQTGEDLSPLRFANPVEEDLNTLFGFPEEDELSVLPSPPLELSSSILDDAPEDLFASLSIENDLGEAALLEMPTDDLHELEALLDIAPMEISIPREPEVETPPDLIPLEILLSIDPQFTNGSLFSALEAYLTKSPVPTSHRSPSPTPALLTKETLSESDFADLEVILDQTENLSGLSLNLSAMSSPAASRVKSRGGRPSRRGSNFEQSMRVPTKQLDTLSNLVGELVVSRNRLEQDQERLRQFLDNLLHQVQQLGDVGQRMQDLYERTLLEMALLSSRQGRSRATSEPHDRSGDFEALEMDRFTEFHTQAQEIIELIVRVRESASDIDFLVTENDQVTRQLRQTTNQLQGGLTQARMVPFSQIADRLPRGIRDNAIKLGKQVELNLEGKETLIDKMILEHLNDPMTHLMNNAIVHGIETPEERAKTGKPSVGRITISTFHQGNQTIISVSDDGAGINTQQVKQKALKNKLITPQQAQQMSDLEVYDLLFLPGFSTRDRADDLSGRGVGLDVVKTEINAIRGTINIDATLGKGTTFTIRLPLTLSISKALCCVCDRANIAFPMDGVAEVLDEFVPQRLITDEKGQQYLPWRDQKVPFQRLSELYKYNRTQRGYGASATDDETISVVVLRSAGTHLAVQVDRAIGEQEIVIKQLSGPIPKPIGIAGATVMGDGRIVPIADVLELIELSLGRVRRDISPWDDTRKEPLPLPEKHEHTVLIIDDSITVRELLSMTFKKAGYRVEQARDGQEAWDKLRAGVPCDLVFCDVEMPRLNGMELLSRMHKDSHLSQLPIAMLTSRAAERHKQMAIGLGARGYFIKPYLEEVLLDAAQRLLRGEVLVTAKAEVGT